MTVEDRRRGAFCWQELRVLADIRAGCSRRNLMSTFAVYCRLTEMAAVRYRDGGRDGFVETRKVLAAGAGVSPNTLDTAIERLEELGVVKVEKRTEGTLDLPSRYILLEAHELAHPTQVDPPNLHTSRAGEPVLLDVDNTVKASSSKKREFEEWLEHHVKVTGNKRMTTPGTTARKKVEQSFLARRREYPDLDLKRISIAAQQNDYRRAHGYTSAESVLRPSGVENLLAEIGGGGVSPESSAASSYVQRMNAKVAEARAAEEAEQ